MVFEGHLMPQVSAYYEATLTLKQLCLGEQAQRFSAYVFLSVGCTCLWHLACVLCVSRLYSQQDVLQAPTCQMSILSIN